MRYKECGEYFGIYVQNPEVCQLLIKRSDFDSDKITSRALVWKLRNGDYFMDRVYYSKDSEVLLYKEYAIREGWAYKKNQSTGSYNTMIGNGDVYTKSLEVQLEKWKFKKYPYLDTIPYLGDDGVLRTGSSRIEAVKAGKQFIGFEIDPEYYEKQEKRFKDFVSQLRLF